MVETVFMDPETIRWGIRVLCVTAAVGTFGLLLVLALCWQPQKLFLAAFEELHRHLRGNRRFLDYPKLKIYLEQNGAAFHFGEWVNPVSYTAVKLVLGGIGLLAGFYFGPFQGMILALMLFWTPDGMLVWLNGKDNERMLPELKLVYNAISMQIRAGVYVTDALAECYGSIREIRLRKAFLTLSGDLAMKADVEDALNHFQDKFDNRYVDALCIIVLQALESGQAVELLSDIAEQMKDMESALMERKKGALDRSITFYQLGILLAVLVVVLYACVTHMFSAALSF